ncbi:non-ribosomal peptide synthetase/type I polyketide synthase [Aquimarina sp. RZ0]|uniref:non-ribosomal peptide synthetase/type I polyketide synthase n=1 Tax=Aquimarina sp. RZ0 TaxID=2607730 RepID=UPI0011F29E8D|nr:non-ribosomal peptide synthetase/type I polyketide synthase [Aquimarina sp. RZ0]KAA1242927.1 amino acid adenylation domain-containing protein [Aquimarina sp. RZ0]
MSSYSSKLHKETLVTIFDKHLKETPEKVIYTFLEDGERELGSRTYKELYERSGMIASHILAYANPGDRVLLIYPTNLDFIDVFFGCVRAGVIAVPSSPPEGKRRIGRLENIVSDCKPTLIFTNSVMYKRIKKWFDHTELSELKWLVTDEIEVSLDKVFLKEITPSSTAFLQYTSGSTGDSKGVIISHSNVLHSSDLIQKSFDHSKESVGVGWLPAFHDMGLIGNMIQPFYVGFPLYFMAPIDFIKKPVRWLKAISKYKATGSGGPNFAYDLCIDQISDEDIKELDLSSWKVAFNGSEPIRPLSLDNFVKRFGKYNLKRSSLFPCYGIAEATLIISGTDYRKAPNTLTLDKGKLLNGQVEASQNTEDLTKITTLVSNGAILAPMRVKIVNPITKRVCKKNEVGEIWIKGPCVGDGYWNREELTKEVFKAQIQYANGKVNTRLGTFLRTGDMGFLKEGELFISGRLKEMFIINGTNHFPQDIERVAQRSHPDLVANSGAAFSIDKDGKEEVILVQELNRNVIRNYDFKEIVNAISKEVLYEHKIPLHEIILVGPGGVEKTTSGKIKRVRTKQLYLSDSLYQELDRWNSKADHIADKTLDESINLTESITEDSIEIMKWIQEKIATVVNVPVHEIDIASSFASFGITSIQGIRLVGELSEFLNMNLSPILLYEYQNISSLTAYLLNESSATLKEEVSIRTHKNEPVAIISMACQFPQAKNVQAFWENLIAGKDAITEVPEERWSLDTYYSETLDGYTMNTKWGGFIDDIDKFDASFFGISPSEAEKMDPQQRLLLEVCYHLFENSQKPPSKYSGSNTGVFIGVGESRYGDLLKDAGGKQNAYSGAGISNSIAANRLSFFYDLKGPSMTIDSACSSSLTCVDMAVKNLRDGDCDVAVAGGVNLVVSPYVSIALSQSGMMSVDGHCKTFDSNANGYVRGDGCGLVLLKPLSKAKEDGNDILAIIRGTAVNQDGNSNGLTAPNGLAQQAVIRKALSKANVTPSSITYVETHGTGTSLGDPIEVKALDQVYNEGRTNPLILGSVKSNIGHLEATAGIAGFIKTVLCLNHHQIPKQLHYHTPNPYIDWKNTNVFIPKEHIPWEITKEHQKRRAGVSSFGFGGTNVHVILEEANDIVSSFGSNSEAENGNFKSIAISAKTDTSLFFRKKELVSYLEKHPEVDMSSLAYSLVTTRDTHEKRFMTVCKDKNELIAALNEKTSDTEHSQNSMTSFEKLKVAFLFTGQSSQYIGMGSSLYKHFPIFKNAMDRCFAILKGIIDIDLKELIFSTAEENNKILKKTQYTQPALFCLGYSLSQLWKHWGIQPKALLGHSIGELTAACVAGIFSLEDGLKLVVSRGKLMQSLPENGGMISLFCSKEETKAFLIGYEDKITIAAINSEKQTVVSGKKEALVRLKKELTKKSITFKALEVSHAFHSPLMEPMLEDFKKVASSIVYYKPNNRIISNITGSEEIFKMCDASYWVDQIRSSVQFSEGVKTLENMDINTFIEMGPSPVLINFGKQIIDSPNTLWLPSLWHYEIEEKTILESLANWYRAGGAINWKEYYFGKAIKSISLPNYPFDGQSYWVNSSSNKEIENNKAEIIKESNLSDDFLYNLSWKPLIHYKTLDGAGSSNWLIICEDNSVFDALYKAIEQKTPALTSITFEEFHDLKKLSDYTHIAVIWPSLFKKDISDLYKYSEELTCKGMRQLQKLGLLLNTKKHKLTHLWWITSEVYDKVSDQGLALSPLWSLSRVFRNEYPQISTNILDVGGNNEDTNKLSNILFNDEAHQQVLYKDNELFTLRLEATRHTKKPSIHLTFNSQKTVLITGALGDMGLQMTKWLLLHTPITRFLLLGRNNPTPKTLSVVEELESLGGHIMVKKVDVTNKEELSRAIAVVPTTNRLGGVIHLASTTDTGLIKDQTIEKIKRVFAPKAQDTWNLHEITKDEELDFFVLFSSIASLFGTIGQAGYAAANGFLDGLANYRKEKGLAVSTINWGQWIGMGKLKNLDEQQEKLLRSDGTQPIENSVDSFALMISIINSKASQMLCTKIDHEKFLEKINMDLGMIPGFYELLTDRKEEINFREYPMLVQELLLLPEHNRLKFLYEKLKKEVCQLLVLEDIDIDQPLMELGLDSLMAIELKNRFSQALGKRIPITLLLDYPTIEACAEHILSEVLGFEGGQEGKTKSLQIGDLKRPSRIPLSYAQERLWFLDQLSGSGEYHIFTTLKLSGEPKVSLIEKTILQIIQRHEVLRSVVKMDQKGEVYQEVLNVNSFLLNHIKLEKGADLDKSFKQVIFAPFDLSTDLMIRVALVTSYENQHYLILSVHHIAADGWSETLILGEFIKRYECLLNNTQPSLHEQEFQYADYSVWQREYLQGEVLDKMLAYWEEQLMGLSPLELPYDYQRPAVQSAIGKTSSFRIDAALTKRLIEFSQAEGNTLFITLLAAFKVLLHKYSGQNDICVGIPIANRTQSEEEQMVGVFMNTLALRNSIDSKETFKEFLSQVRKTTLKAYDYQSTPFEKVVERLSPERDLSRSPIFQVMFGIQNSPDVRKLDFGDITLTKYEIENTTSKFDLSFTIIEEDDYMALDVEYCTALFTVETIERFAAHYKLLLNNILNHPSSTISEITLLSTAEKKQILIDFNSTTKTLVSKKITFVDLFQEQVKLTPTAIAIVCDQEEITYDELDRRSNKIANYLIKRKVGKDSLIGICMERSIDMIEAVLGVLKSGDAYVPIGSNYPESRISYILEETQCKVVITDQSAIENIPRQLDLDVITGTEITSETSSYKEVMPDIPISGSSLAYVIYTSGSTGRPKGAMIEHDGMLNHLLVMVEKFAMNANTIIGFTAPFTFDISVWQMLSALLSGGKVIIYKETLIQDGVAFLERFYDDKITLLQLVPSYLSALLDTPSIKDFSRLKYLLVTGESVHKSLLSTWFEKYPKIPVSNAYGPTEAADDVSLYFMDQVPLSGRIPIGKPIANTKLYVMSDNNTLCPIGVIGELWVSGIGVGRGYLNDDDKTEVNFIADPFNPGQGVYKTGDLARWLPDGNLEFIGRKDNQVKIRGYRIELGEIENVLSSIDPIKECAVLVKEDIYGNTYLIGFVTLHSTFDKKYIDMMLKQLLPEYMIPTVWLAIEEMPITRHGKIDRKALAATEVEVKEEELLAPTTELEKQLVAIFADLLSLKQIGVNQNLYSLGLHSLLIIKVAARVKQELDIRIPVKMFFEFPTIKQLAFTLSYSINKIRNAGANHKVTINI